MASCEVSAVLFAKDHARLAAFYRDALGFVFTGGDEDHSVLNCSGFDLIVHQIPKHLLDEPKVEGVPTPRKHGAFRLNVPVDSIETARSRAASLGGQVDDVPPPWAAPDGNIYLGHDPEGNVFKLSQRGR
jgi:predicted enzyme related to lactoylglutathione lyase